MSKNSKPTKQLKRRKRRNASTSESVEEIGNSVQSKAEVGFKSRADREVEVQQRVIRIVGVIVAILVFVILAAFVVEQVIVPNQAVATVNGETITVSQFREAVTFERNRLLLQFNQLQAAGLDVNQIAQQEPYATWLNEINVPDQLGLRVLNDMVDEILTRQEAEQRNITVDEQAIEQEVNDFFGYDPTEVALIGAEPTATDVPTETPTPFVSPTPSPTPTLTPTLGPDETQEVVEPTITPQPTVVEPTLSAEEVTNNFNESQDNFRNFFSTAGIGQSVVDKYFEYQALQNILADELFGESGTILYADVRHILVDSEETALEILDSLNNGASFSDLAKAVSTDPGSGSRGGELGESYVGNYVPEFREAVETAEIGALVGPVETDFGFHIIQVRSREERSSDDIETELEVAKRQEFTSYIEDLREDSGDNIEIFDTWIDYVPRG